MTFVTAKLLRLASFRTLLNITPPPPPPPENLF